MSANDIHFQALCNSIENERLDKCRSILLATLGPNPNPVLSSRGPIDLTLANNDGFTPLDLAFMTGNHDLMDLVLEYGAKEGQTFPSPEAASAHLHTLIHESKKQIEKFGQLIKAAHTKGTNHIPNLPTQLSQSQLKECEKQQTLWQKRMATLKRLKQGLDSSGCPHAPSEVSVEVLDCETVNVRLTRPASVNTKSLYTKCKIQWSAYDSFSRLDGELTVTEVRNLEFKIEKLYEGQRYFFRASFGNPKGFGPFCASTPKSLEPSSWRSVEEKQLRLSNQLEVCVNAFSQFCEEYDDDYEPQKFLNKRKGFLNNLFTSSSAPKLQRQLQGNHLYLACVLFHEDKVLMTHDEVLPIMEVDAELPTNVMAEFQWLAKLSFNFQDVERLRREMAKINGSSSNSRYKIIQAVSNMQHYLGLTDLGSPYHKPFQNSDGSVVYSLIYHVKNPKSLVSLSLKWVSLSRAQRRSSFDNQINSMDLLRYSLREQILFQQVCDIKLSKGFYLCYVQAESTIDSMRVIVSNTSPTILPYVKVRDNAHVSKDEWAWINRLGRVTSQSSSMQAPSPTTNFLAGEGEEGSESLSEEIMKQLKPTENQYFFGKQLLLASERLFDYLEIDLKDRSSHVIFDSELIELSPQISIAFLLPPADIVCSVADNKPLLNLNRNDLLGINLPMFESLHMAGYHRELITSFYRVTLHLDVGLIVAKQNQREAFSNAEIESAQRSLKKLQDVQHNLEETWKSMRWLLDVLSQGRQKSTICGLTQQHLSDWYRFQTEPPDDSDLVYEVSKKKDGLRRLFRQDTMSQINSAIPYDPRASSSSASGTLTTGMKNSLTRTPTTRSDPLEFNIGTSNSSNNNNNKENEVRNFPRLPHQHQSGPEFEQHANQISPGSSSNLNKKTATSSSYSSLTFSSQQSTNSSLSSNSDQFQNPPPPLPANTKQPQYENLSTDQVARNGRVFDPRVAQSGRFSNLAETTPSSQSRRRFQSSPEPNVLQVYAAYETGLASGTSVKLNVNHDTTTREVIDLVIKQLNMAVILKGKEGPIYENDKLKNFCLVAVIGNRERCLRDDFKPLNLQNPWKSGKLFVRMKNDLLAAIDHISRHSTML